MKLLPFSITLLFIITVNFLQGEIAFAQLQIAPSAIYMNEKNTTERIVIRNSSEEPVEVEIELIFGYPSTDEHGKVYFKHVTVDEFQPSAIEWIRIYPRFFILAPGERQTVRFAARPPGNLPEGEYWARPAIVAQIPSVKNSNEGNDITTQLNLRKRTILALSYRNGEVNSGITINNLSAEVEEDIINVTTHLQRLGNAAYIGHYEVFLTDLHGRTQKTEKKEMAVYNDQMRSFIFDSGGLDSGTYNVELKLYTHDRSSIGIIPAPSSTSTTTFTIP